MRRGKDEKQHYRESIQWSEDKLEEFSQHIKRSTSKGDGFRGQGVKIQLMGRSSSWRRDCKNVTEAEVASIIAEIFLVDGINACGS